MKAELFEKTRGNSPIADYIGSLDAKDAKKITNYIDRLVDDGGLLRLIKTRDVKQFRGHNNLYELRPSYFRVFFYIKDEICRMLHIFRKKSDETPRKELNKALQIKEEWEMRDEKQSK